jgi:putative MATE family efflux protein
LKNLTEGNLLKNLVIYSYPIIIGDLLQATFNSIDAVWVGRLIGANALAAISAVGPLMFLIIALIIGIAIATVILVGQSYGSKDLELLKKIIVNSYMVIFVMCLIISALAVAFSGELLGLLHTPDSIKSDAKTFLVIIFSGLIFMFSFNWFSGVLRGMGDSRTPFVLQIISVGLNIILAPVLITGAGLFHGLGIAGSALATVISQASATVAAFIYMARKDNMLNVLKWNFKPDFGIIKRMFTVGAPVSVQMLINALSSVIIISFVNLFGPNIIAGFGLGMRVDQYSYMPAMSLGEAVSAMVAQHLGAGKKEKIPEILRNAVLFSISISLIFYISVNFLPGKIASIFTTDTRVWDAVKWYWRIDSPTYFAFAMLFAFQGVIRGSGDTIPLTIIAFITLIIFRAGTTYLLVHFTGLHQLGIWLAMAISAYVGALLSYIYYRSGKWIERYKPHIIETADGING